MLEFIKKALSPGAAPDQNAQSASQEMPRGATEGQQSAASALRKRSISQQHVKKSIYYERMFDNGICELGGGLYSKTISFTDINYQSARREEQIDIFSRWCETLSSLDPGVHLQLTIHDRNINKDNFRQEMLLTPQRDNLNGLRDETNAVLEQKALQGQNNIIRNKYVTYTVRADSAEIAQASLLRLEAELTGSFKALGCITMPLSGLQRVSLLGALTRPDDVLHFRYVDLVLQGMTTKDIVAPMSFTPVENGHFTFGGKHGCVLVVREYPTELSDKLLSDITELPINLTVNLHVDRVAQSDALELVRRKIAWLEMEQTGQQDKAVNSGRNPEFATPASMRRKYADALKLLDSLEKKNQRMFKTTLLVFTYSDTPEELKNNIARIRTAAAQNGCTIAALDLMEEEGFNSTLPLGRNFVPIRRTMTTASAAVIMPFTAQELFQKGGIYYGLNASSRNLIFLNRSALPAAGGFYLGKPGSGKSMAAKWEMLQVLLTDPDAEVIVIDPDREYAPLCHALDGEYIHISASSEHHLNPMEINDYYADTDNPMSLKGDFVLTLMDLLAGGSEGLNSQQKTVVSRATMLCYQNYYAHLGKSQMPTLTDFYEILKAQPEPEAQGLALALELYVHGTLSVFSHPTNVDTNKRLVVYDIRDLGTQLRTFGMMVVLDQIWNRISRNRGEGRHTWFYVDELQIIFDNAYAANYFFQIWSRGRKWGVVPTGITQNVETLLLSDLARRMLSNSDFVMMLDQSQSDREELASLFALSQKQLSSLTAASPGNGLLRAGKHAIAFENDIPKDTSLYRMMTTKLEEVTNGS